MQYPLEKLKKMYYFINDNVIYNISSYQDADDTGVDCIKYNDDGTINEAECENIFPNIKVVYRKNDGTDVTKYYWLQNMIKDGDTKTEDGPFIINNLLDQDDNGKPDEEYLDVYLNWVKEEILKRINNGQTAAYIKKALPYYITAVAGDKVRIDGETVTIIEIVNNDMSDVFSEEGILELIYEAINAKTINYANKLLAIHDKVLEEGVVLVDAEKVKDIEEDEGGGEASPRPDDPSVTGEPSITGDVEPELSYEEMPLTFEIVEPGTITFVTSSGQLLRTIEFSVDEGQNWTEFTSSTTVTPLGNFNVGDKIQFRGVNTNYGTGSNHNTFGGTAKFNVYGNIMSLVNKENFSEMTTLSGSYNFYQLFDNAAILSAENLILPAATLTNSCYQQMFEDCASLTTAPELPATTLAVLCYNNMFNGCESLENAPIISATTLAEECCDGMFKNCTSLVTGPVLHAQSLMSHCYANMFDGCTSLNYIKFMSMSAPSDDTTSNWINGISPAQQGTFVMSRDASWDPEDYRYSDSTDNTWGIPYAWTIEMVAL